MKILKNKKLLSKLLISLCLVVMLSGTIVKPVQAVNMDNLGGKLLNATMNLFVAIGDGIMGLVQDAILGNESSLIEVPGENGKEGKGWSFLSIVITIVGVAAGIALICTGLGSITGGAILAGIVAGIKGAGVIALTIAGVTVLGKAKVLVNSAMPNDSFFFPVYEVTPYEIFSDRIFLFDADFFGNKKYYKTTKRVEEQELDTSKYYLCSETERIQASGETYYKYAIAWIHDNKIYANQYILIEGENNNVYVTATAPNGSTNIATQFKIYSLEKEDKGSFYNQNFNPINAATITSSGGSVDGISDVERRLIRNLLWENDMTTSLYRYNKDTYFDFLKQSGLNGDPRYDDSSKYHNLKLNDVTISNMINSINTDPKYNVIEEEVEIDSTATELKSVISKWYKIVRAIAITISMIVLVFIGIKIVIGSNNAEKAKYKEMLVDWIVSICLIFIMNYIMIFANQVVSLTIKFIDGLQFSNINIDNIDADDATKNAYKNITNSANLSNDPQITIIPEDDHNHVNHAYRIMVEEGNSQEYAKLFFDADGNQYDGSGYEFDKSGPAFMYWPTNNFLKQARLDAQLNTDGDNATETSVGYKLIFVVLVIFTLIYAWTYLKRIIYLAFLTVIAPFVALTYPIDKITDGKAQAFDMWIKEYIFNLLIQPMHLLLYIILIGSAMQFASENIVYVVVALGFMTPAEKMVRKFFGFEKAHTPGLLAGPAGHALMMTGIGKLARLNRPPRGSRGEGESEQKAYNDNNIKYSKGKDGIDKYGNGGPQITATAGTTEETPNLEEETPGLDKSVRTVSSAYIPTQKTTESRNTGVRTTATSAVTPTLAPEPVRVEKSERSAGDTATAKKTKHPFRAIRRATGYAGKRALKGYTSYGNRLNKKYSFGNAVKFTGRVAAGGVGAVAGGIASISSGDPTKAAQGVITGAYAGSTVGRRIIESPANTIQGAIDTVNSREMQQEVSKGYYGSEYLQRRREQAEEKFKKDDKNIDFLTTHMDVGISKAKKIMNSSVVDKAIKSGIYDMTDLATIYQMVNEKHLDEDDAIRKAAIGRDMGKHTSKMGNEEYRDTRRKIAEGYKAKNPVSDEDALRKAEEIMQQIDNDYFSIKMRIKQNDPDKD